MRQSAFDNSYNSYVGGGGVSVLIHPVVIVVLIVHGYKIFWSKVSSYFTIIIKITIYFIAL